MKTTILALVASLSIAFIAPGIASADVGANTGDKNVTAPKVPTGKVPSMGDKNAKAPGEADKNGVKAPKVKLPKGKMAMAKKTPAHGDAHKHVAGKPPVKHS